MTEAAELLGLHRSNLYRKMRQLGMPPMKMVSSITEIAVIAKSASFVSL